MPIPTELVGSLPRPMKLQEAYQAYDDGKITYEDLHAEQDEAAADSIKRLEATGQPVTDGEQRESSFATYPITDTLAGTGLADNLAADGQYFAIFDDGHHRQLPWLTGGSFRSPEERRNIGIHTCPGGDCDSVHRTEVPSEPVLSKMFQRTAGYFRIPCASEEDKEAVHKLCGQYSREDADGVAQVCFMGVINPLSPAVETPEQVKQDLVTAARHIPVDRLGATDDCGFSPFSRDLKPKHGSPDFARDIAMQKISARLEGARLASEELGVW